MPQINGKEYRMAITVNANSGSLKTFNHQSRVGHLLSLAVTKMSGISRLDSGQEDAGGLEIEKSFSSKTNQKNNLNSIQDSDQVLASPGGWARMGALGGKSSGSLEIKQGLVEGSLQKARQDIKDRPLTALELQARLSPDSVIKLLE